MKVPLSTFTSFVGAAPTAKIATVERIKAASYDPRTDWWKGLREFLPRIHRDGGGKREQLDEFVASVSTRKAATYHARAAEYKRW